ncbi:MAG: hypothetical protein GX625_16500 [Clostridiaceae bacterium]|jgi:hypothetical protein|nr:hypothetical protein [Clostridiaceae bacterium]
MARQDNYSTVEPMTEAEAMQAARNNMVYLEQLAYLVWSWHDRGMPFLEAREKAIKVAEEKGDDFMHYPQAQEKYPTETMLAYCFPELTEKNIAALLKWKRKRNRPKTRNEGRRSRRSQRKNLWRIWGESHWRANRFIKEVPWDEDSPEEHLNVLEDELKVVAVFQHMINTRYSGRRFKLPMRTTYTPRTSSRDRRAPARSSAKSDDGGGDGGSDQGEPPRPSYTGRVTPPAPIQARLIPFCYKVNSFIPSRTPLPCYWCMDWRWAA